MMCEWGIPFDHIEEHWTFRQFEMMAQRLNERLKKQRDAMTRPHGAQPNEPCGGGSVQKQTMSMKTFLNTLGANK